MNRPFGYKGKAKTVHKNVHEIRGKPSSDLESSVVLQEVPCVQVQVLPATPQKAAQQQAVTTSLHTGFRAGPSQQPKTQTQAPTTSFKAPAKPD